MVTKDRRKATTEKISFQNSMMMSFINNRFSTVINLKNFYLNFHGKCYRLYSLRTCSFPNLVQTFLVEDLLNFQLKSANRNTFLESEVFFLEKNWFVYRINVLLSLSLIFHFSIRSAITPKIVLWTVLK